MSDIRIAGVMRAGVFSPNHIGNDAAIFNLVAEQLRKRGCTLDVYSEEQFDKAEIKERFILNMCRRKRSIERLQQMEDNGAVVVNSGYGIQNCTRERMARILRGCGIPYPETFIVETDEKVKDRLVKADFNACWVKKGEGHTMHREDVAFARHPQEAQELVQEFFLRGIRKAVINRHVPGDLVKFYGVANTNFFYWFYPADVRSTRYTPDPATATSLDHAPFELDTLKRLCAKASEVLDVKIYGGDCIISPDGAITIIDFDDWPSFAPCRTTAAPVIARMVYNLFKKNL